MTDIRYYAITRDGRMRLSASSLEAACEEVRACAYMRGRATRIVREERKTYELANLPQ